MGKLEVHIYATDQHHQVPDSEDGQPWQLPLGDKAVAEFVHPYQVEGGHVALVRVQTKTEGILIPGESIMGNNIVVAPGEEKYLDYYGMITHAAGDHTQTPDRLSSPSLFLSIGR